MQASSDGTFTATTNSGFTGTTTGPAGVATSQWTSQANSSSPGVVTSITDGASTQTSEGGTVRGVLDSVCIYRHEGGPQYGVNTCTLVEIVGEVLKDA